MIPESKWVDQIFKRILDPQIGVQVCYEGYSAPVLEGVFEHVQMKLASMLNCTLKKSCPDVMSYIPIAIAEFSKGKKNIISFQL